MGRVLAPEANGVFVRMPPDLISTLGYDAEGNHVFHVWDARAGIARLMCSWDTTAADIDAFSARTREAATQPQRA